MHLDPGPLVVVLVLAAAVLHATWNAIAHAAEDRLVGFALISTSTLVLGTCMVLVGEPVGWHYFWLAALSAALHVAYLSCSWPATRSPTSAAPTRSSRGTGVALTAIASIVLPRSPLGVDVVVGTGLVVLGLVGVTLAGPRLTVGDDARGIATALGTGVAIAGYTVVDGLSVSGGAPVVAYAGWLMLLQSWVVPLYAVAKRGRAPARDLAAAGADGLGGGVVSLVAYGLVLLAQTSGALAAVAALRELSIALGRAHRRFVLHEAAARKRLLPALVLTAGAVVLALSIDP